MMNNNFCVPLSPAMSTMRRFWINGCSTFLSPTTRGPVSPSPRSLTRPHPPLYPIPLNPPSLPHSLIPMATHTQLVPHPLLRKLSSLLRFFLRGHPPGGQTPPPRTEVRPHRSLLPTRSTTQYTTLSSNCSSGPRLPHQTPSETCSPSSLHFTTGPSSSTPSEVF